MDNEEWKDIPEWEGYYQASSTGRVRSLDRITKSRPAKGVIKKQTLMNSGYLTVGLCDGKNHEKRLVHRLVALSFLPKEDGKEFVNHKNGVKTDNRLDNLEWCTKSYNLLHAYQTGCKTITKKHIDRLIKFNKETKSKKIAQYSIDNVFIKEFTSGQIASSETGINYSCLMACAENHPKHKTAGGYLWRFVNPY